MRKNATKIAALALSLALTVTSVNVPTNASAASVKLNKTKATLYLNGPSKKKVSKLVVKGTNKKVTFTSSNKSVVKVNKNGKITAKATGKATITAKVNKKSYKCNVTVKKTYKPVTGITVSPKTVTLNVGKTKTLKTTVKPEKPTNKKVAYTSDRTSVAKVSSTGKVTAKKAGTAKITVKTKGINKNNKHKKATVAVTVKDPNAPDASTAPSNAPSAEPSAKPSDAPGNEPTLAPAEGLRVMAVTPLTSTKINVTFSMGVDETVSASNFTISDGASVTGVEFNEDRTVATLVVNGLTPEQEYTLTVSGVTAGDEKLENDFTTTFTAKKDEAKLKIVTGLEDAEVPNTLKADGKSSANVQVSLVDENDNLLSELDSVELKFDATAGNFANDTVTIQNGVAENTFTSESLVNPKTAKITVTVINTTEANKNLRNYSAVTNILLDPNPGTNVGGITLTDIEVETADKVALFFDKEVNVEDYTSDRLKEDAIYHVDPLKLGITVENAARTKNGKVKEVPVYALGPVTGNSHALYAYLGTGPDTRDELIDNSELEVTVTDHTKNESRVSSASAVLQDIKDPSVLGVTNNGLRKLVLTFSESVNWETNKNSTQWNSSAVNPANYVIDGVPLTNFIYGNTTKAKVSNSGFDWVKGVDNSNIVTITLGKKSKDEKIYLTPGKHSIQISNVGDVANRTDNNNNKLVTQSLDFTVDPDDTLIQIEDVEVQSPEQYIITLNRVLDEEDEEDVTDTAEELLKKYLKLQQLDIASNSYKPVTMKSTEELDIDVVPNSDRLKFRVQTRDDWTVYHNTESTHKNYYNYNYRLHIDEGLLMNPANGKKNAEINVPLNDPIMTNPDVTSPEIQGIKLNSDNYTFNIELSEPVQVPQIMDDGVLTPNQVQLKGQGIPNPTVTFIKSDKSETIPATIDKANIYDKVITVHAQDDLSVGTWQVVVASISDDVGNTASTLTAEYEIKKAVVAGDTFRPLWIVAVPFDSVDPNTSQQGDVSDPIRYKHYTGGQSDPVDGYVAGKYDVVYIKYSANISTVGSSENVVSTANYQVNGYTIPVETRIDATVPGYNDNILGVYGSNSAKDTIAIYLKAGTLAKQSNNVFIGTTLRSAENAKITNAGLKTLEKVVTASSSSYFRWQYDKKFAIDSVVALKETLADDNYTYVKVATGAAFKDENKDKDAYTISKEMHVDFSNHSAKSLTIDTKATGKIIVENLEVKDITIDAPNADVEFKNVRMPEEVKDTEGTITLKNVLSNLTFDAYCNWKKLTITSDVTHDIYVNGELAPTKSYDSIEVGDVTIIETVDNNSNAGVTFDPMHIVTLNQKSDKLLVLNNVYIDELNIKAAATLRFEGEKSTIGNLNVQEKIKFAAIEINTSNKPEISKIFKDATFDVDGKVKSQNLVADLTKVADENYTDELIKSLVDVTDKDKDNNTKVTDNADLVVKVITDLEKVLGSSVSMGYIAPGSFAGLGAGVTDLDNRGSWFGTESIITVATSGAMGSDPADPATPGAITTISDNYNRLTESGKALLDNYENLNENGFLQFVDDINNFSVLVKNVKDDLSVSGLVQLLLDNIKAVQDASKVDKSQKATTTTALKAAIEKSISNSKIKVVLDVDGSSIASDSSKLAAGDKCVYNLVTTIYESSLRNGDGLAKYIIKISTAIEVTIVE